MQAKFLTRVVWWGSTGFISLINKTIQFNKYLLFHHMFAVRVPRSANETGLRLNVGCKPRIFSPSAPYWYFFKKNRIKGFWKSMREILYLIILPFSVCAQLHTASPWNWHCPCLLEHITIGRGGMLREHWLSVCWLINTCQVISERAG